MTRVPSLSFISGLVTVQALLDLREDTSPGLTCYVVRMLNTQVFTAVSEGLLTRIVNDFPGRLQNEMLQALAPPHLKSLSLKGCTALTPTALFNLLQKCESLHSLDLTECSQLAFTEVMQLCSSLTSNLTSLTLSSCDTVTDETVQTVISSNPYLQHLDVSCCKNVTDRMFDLKCDHAEDKEVYCPLSFVDISGCCGITSEAVRLLVAIFGTTLTHINLAFTKMDPFCLFYLSTPPCSSKSENEKDITKDITPHNSSSSSQREGRASAQFSSLSLVETKQVHDGRLDAVTMDTTSFSGQSVLNITEPQQQCTDQSERGAESFFQTLSGAETKILDRRNMNSETFQQKLFDADVPNSESQFSGDDRLQQMSSDTERLESGTHRTNSQPLEIGEICSVDNVQIELHDDSADFQSQNTASRCSMQSAEKVNFPDIHDRNMPNVCDSDRKSRELQCEGLNQSESDVSPSQTCERVTRSVTSLEQKINCWTSETEGENNCTNDSADISLIDRTTARGSSSLAVVESMTPTDLQTASANVSDSIDKPVVGGTVSICGAILENHSGERTNNVGSPPTQPVCVALPGYMGKHITNSVEALPAQSLAMSASELQRKQETDNGESSASQAVGGTLSENPNEKKSSIVSASVSVAEATSENQQENQMITVQKMPRPFTRQEDSNHAVCSLTCEDTVPHNSCTSRLLHVDLNGVDLDLGNELTNEFLKKFAMNNPQLEHLSLSWKSLNDEVLEFISRQLPQLSRVSLIGCDSVSSWGLSKLCNNCPKLEHLDVEGVVFISDWSVTAAVNSGRLKKLILSAGQITDVTLRHIAQTGQLQLRHLDLSWCEDITTDGLNAVCEHCTELRSLSMRQCPASPDTLSLLSSNCLHLTSLNIASVMDVQDASLVSIALRMRSLCELDVSWNLSITDVGVSAILNFCLQLQKMNVSGIKQMTSKPFMPIISGYEKWQRCQALLRFKYKERQILQENNDPMLSSDEEFEDLSLPHRSTIYAPNLRHVDMEYSDTVTDSQIREVVAVCRGSLRVIDYYGQEVLATWIPHKKCVI